MVDMTDKEDFFCISIVENQQLNFADIFKNSNPVVLEIGSGKGEFIATYSALNPHLNFLAVELKSKRIITTLKKLDIVKNCNVRLLRQFIDDKVTSIIPRNSISEIIINHPDPWPKRKHHKNRLIQNPFIDAINSILQIGCHLKISTDDPDYRQWICRIFTQRKDFINLYDDGYTMTVPPDHLWTYFDEKQSKAGLQPAFMKYKKLEDI